MEFRAIIFPTLKAITMNFAITATDRFLGVFDAFVSAGWKPLKLFTVPMAHPLSNQQAVIAYAQKHDAAIQLSRMTEHDLAELRELGCEALIVASYDWKIPNWQPYLKYAVNFHSSPLPEGRGPYPASRAILENRDSWAVTCHRVTEKIDQGEILAVDTFALQADECHESIDLKIQISAKRLASKVAANLDVLWEQAQPQAIGQYWRKTGLQERVIDFLQPTAVILRHIRAYGTTESLFKVNNNWFVVKRAVGWPEQHYLLAGQLAHVFNRSLVVTSSDGYIGLLDCEAVPPNFVAEIEAAMLNG
jgi:methionyl-tRNA formyltransferase